jgi:hypothetical protein
MRAQLFLSLILAVAGTQAVAAPEIRLSNMITNADGSRQELVTRFHAPTRGGFTVNEAVIEVLAQPPEPIRPGAAQPPEPVRYRIEGRARSSIGEAFPCIMPAAFLLAKGYVSARQIFDALGLNVEITETSGRAASLKDPGADGTALAFMLAQVAASRPDRAPLVARLIADAGFPAGAICLPASR